MRNFLTICIIYILSVVLLCVLKWWGILALFAFIASFAVTTIINNDDHKDAIGFAASFFVVSMSVFVFSFMIFQNELKKEENNSFECSTGHILVCKDGQSPRCICVVGELPSKKAEK